VACRPVADNSVSTWYRRDSLDSRIPGKNRYRLTGDGLRFAIFYTNLHDRLLRPLLVAASALAAGARISAAETAAIVGMVMFIVHPLAR
jgi:hypothetical protein